MLQRPLSVIASFAALSILLTLWKKWMIFGCVLVSLAMAVILTASFVQKETKRKTIYKIVAMAAISFILFGGWTSLFDQGKKSQISEWDEKLIRGKTVSATGDIVSPVKVDGDRVSFTMNMLTLELPDRKRTLKNTWWKKERVQVSIWIANERERDSVASWTRGDRVRLIGQLERPLMATNFGAFDYREYLHWQGIHWVFRMRGLDHSHVIERTDRLGIIMFHQVDRWRNIWGSRIDQLFPDDQNGWMKSMTIGLRDDIDAAQLEQFSLIGMTHILAISGLHVGVFVLILTFIFKMLRLTEEVRIRWTIVLLPFYIVLTGAAPSAMRAGIMGMIALYAHLKGNLRDGLQIVSGTAIVMLLFNPYYLMNISFQFSFIVTIGLIVLIPKLNERLHMRPRILRDTLSVTIVAQVVSFPITVYYFHHVSLLSGLANFIFVPIISMIILPIAIFSVIVSVFHAGIGAAVAQLAIVINRYILSAIQFLNAVPYTHIHWASPSLTWLFVYFVCILILFHFFSIMNNNQQPIPLFDRRLARIMSPLSAFRPLLLYTSAFISGTILLCMLIYGYAPQTWNRYGEISFIDVGQGDAIFIRTPTNKTLLIDTGGNWQRSIEDELWRQRQDPFEVGKDVLVPLLKSRGVQKLDYIFITHHDYDHIGGLRSVLERIGTRRLIINGTLKDQDFVRESIQLALDQGTELFTFQYGDELEIDRVTAITGLYPIAESTASLRWEEDQNAHSIVFLLEMYGRRFLFTGDIHAEDEQAILLRLTEDKGHLHEHSIVDVMKAAHHGSKTSSSISWLAHWRPQSVVISSGRNNLYGHPHAEVVQRFQSMGSRMYRTDEKGEIQFRISSDAMKVRTKLAEQKADQQAGQ